MKIFTEDEIERTFHWLENNQENSEALFQTMDDAQPAILGYILSDGYNILDTNEKELLVFASLVIFHCTRLNDSSSEMPLISVKDIEIAEEANYEMIDEQASYDSQISMFFQDYRQEDLLAFVEDFITSEEDEDLAVSKEARLPIFIMLKTIIDVLTITNS